MAWFARVNFPPFCIFVILLGEISRRLYAGLRTQKQRNMTANLFDASAFRFAASVEIRFADMDAFGHVNNAVYLTYFEHARAQYWREIIQWDWKALGIILARAEVDYVRQLTVRDHAKVYVRTSRVGNSSFDLHYALVSVGAESEETLVAQGMTTCVAFDYQTQKPSPIPEPQRTAMQQDAEQNFPS